MATIKKRDRKDGGVSWDAWVRVKGYPTQCRSFRTKDEAEEWASKTTNAAKGRTLVLRRDITLSELIDKATPKLRRPVAAALRCWREKLGDLRLVDVTPTRIAAVRDELLGQLTRGHEHKRMRPRSAGTVRSYLACLSAIFNVGMRELQWCDSNPVARVQAPPPGPGRIRFLNDAERKALLASCRVSEAPALYALVLAALTTGARRGELYGLRWMHVDLDRRWAIFPTTKNGHPRGVPLTPALVQELRAIRVENDERVFRDDMTRAWHTALRRAGIDAGFRFHDLRHSAASMLVQSGANLAEVATLLGHRDIRMTMRYAHVHNAHTQALVDRVMGGIEP